MITLLFGPCDGSHRDTARPGLRRAHSQVCPLGPQNQCMALRLLQSGPLRGFRQTIPSSKLLKGASPRKSTGPSVS
jgi:hypothetical protein